MLLSLLCGSKAIAQNILVNFCPNFQKACTSGQRGCMQSYLEQFPKLTPVLGKPKSQFFP